MIIPAVKYVIYGCSSSKTTPGVINIQELQTGRKALLQLLLKIGLIDDNLKGELKTFYNCRLFLLARIFQYISNLSKVFDHLPTVFLQYTQSINFSKFLKIINFSVNCAQSWTFRDFFTF